MIAYELRPSVVAVQPHSSVCDTAIAWIMLGAEVTAPPPPPSPAASGEAILASDDLREVDNAHLTAKAIHFGGEVPYGGDAITERLLLMIHAGVRHPDKTAREEALQAREVILDQLLCDAGSLESIAEQAAEVQELDPEVIEACLRLDLAGVPDLVDEAVALGADETQLVSAVAPLFVIAAAFKIQLEGCLGFRLLHCPMNGRVTSDVQRVWTIGQVFSPHIDKHEFAVEMMDLHEANIAAGVTKVTDGRVVGRIKRMAAGFGISGLEPANDVAICDKFVEGGAPDVGALLRRHRSAADAAVTHFRSITGNQRRGGAAGKRLDSLSAPITAVQRLAIVCARALEVARLARAATTADDLRAMLVTSLPRVLRISTGNQRNSEALRLRMLFHAARVAFLRDGEHLPKSDKGRADAVSPSIELPDWAQRRARKTMKACLEHLTGLPRGWCFATWFGWEHDSLELEGWHDCKAA